MIPAVETGGLCRQSTVTVPTGPRPLAENPSSVVLTDHVSLTNRMIPLGPPRALMPSTSPPKVSSDVSVSRVRMAGSAGHSAHPAAPATAGTRPEPVLTPPSHRQPLARPAGPLHLLLCLPLSSSGKALRRDTPATLHQHPSSRRAPWDLTVAPPNRSGVI